MGIDWKRMAEPQEDQYDSRVALELACTTTAPQRPEPYRRRPVGYAPTIFDGRVAVRYVARECPGHPINRHGPLRHPNIDRAVDYVRRWPAAYEQFKTLIDTFHPMVLAGMPESEWPVHRGSSSHSYDHLFGVVFATVYNPMGLAEAFVHEMAHNKLRALGVYFESAQRIVANPPDELCESPIRKDRLRPLTAVLHAQYSFMYVTALNLAMIEAETDPGTRREMHVYLAYNVPRMEMGYEVLRRHLKVDEAGRDFIAGFYDWSDRVLEEGNRRLREAGITKPDPSRFVVFGG